ncbi:MAG: peptidoglycan DD-metalloendopeptidase family protein [Vampirovibrionales bacterium]|nr:peptidoglycan DD-metalloendopeptidase family protein [Vampirovibrionales bacterium]
MISTNLSIPNRQPMPVPSTGQNQATAQSPPSGMGSDVNQLLNDTNYLTAGMQATAQQNEQAQKAKELQEAQKLMQQQYISALPANQANASQPSVTSPANSPTVMPRSASMPASENVSTVDQVKGFVANAWNEASQLIANTARSATQFVTGAPAQAATSPPPAMPATNPTGGGASGNGGFINPLPSGKSTSGFGMRNHPVHGGQKMHNGQDLAAPMGTAIQAAADGEVTINAFEAKGYGNWIEIKHPNGKSTRYGHMKDKSPLAVGTKVTQGQVIGSVGSTGASTGPHLHFEVRNTAGKAENPVAYLPDLNKSKKA